MLVAALAGAGVAYGLYREDKEVIRCCGECIIDAAPTAIALGARGNTPIPVLHQEVLELLTRASDAEQPISVYRVDGGPSPAINETFHTSAKAGGPRQRDLDIFMTNLQQAIGSVRAKVAEADPLRALWFAARDIPDGGTVILYDSGLQTVAPLDFRAPGMLEAEAADVVAFLKKADAIPDVSGRNVLLVGVGDTVVPQDNLDQRAHENVVAIWTAIAEAGNAACLHTFPDPPRTVEPMANVPPVSVIPVEPPPPPPPQCGEIKLSNGGDVGFRPDSDVFRDIAAARQFLRGYADTILERKQHVELLGTTARWGSRGGQESLGVKRAEAVKRLLVELGVPADSVTTKGVGSYWDGYRPDGGPNGPLEPATAALNRSVVVRLTCP